MSCPKCGHEIIGKFCSQCGYRVDNTNFESSKEPLPPQQPQSPYGVQTYYQQPPQKYPNSVYPPQNFNPSPPLEWYKDGSIWGIVSIPLSIYLIWSVSTIIGIICGLIGLILAVNSKKRCGRIPLLSIILTAIVFAIELIIIGIVYLIAFTIGAI